MAWILFQIKFLFAHGSLRDGNTWLHPCSHIHRRRQDEVACNRQLFHCYTYYGDIDSNPVCHVVRHDVIACFHGAAACCVGSPQLAELWPQLILQSLRSKQQLLMLSS